MPGTEECVTERITIVEVGPRDGLQNEPGVVPPAVKVELIERLVAAGLSALEIASFVRPDRIPQLADGDEVAAALDLPAHVRAIALAPNAAGLDRAVRAGVGEVAVFVAASDQFNLRNVNRTTDAAIEMFRPVVDGAQAAGVRVRGYVSTVLGCPYQGHVPLDDVCRVAEALVELGCGEISLGDTIGIGTPFEVRRLVRRVADVVPVERLAAHMHDTYGMGLANSLAAIDEGVRTVDASVGGLGGCPYAGPGARGNLATEDLVYALRGSGFDTGVDLDALVDTSWWLAGQLGRDPYARVATALGRPADS
ncbi:MAG TPA: hydroxymethylglutaryl-CoA lyase [Ilumatobacter sp.]|nr:hydroxymethylglutaryl-CoA lyase [Ilumatobacter sp.]